MDAFTSLMGRIDDIVWCNALVVLCLGAGLYFSIRMKFPQVRLIKEMARLLVSGEKSDSGITPFQAFAATVGSRVGMGNIAGVATAIYFGGPGAVFWMWCIAFIGASSAFIESSLAQAYKVKGKDGEYAGGPAYFIERALHCRPYAIVFALVTILGPGMLMPGQQINSITATFQEAFGMNVVVVGAIFVVVLGLVVCGGIKRIGKVAEFMAPFMCVIYVVMAVGVIGLNITKIPSVFGMIFSSAFGIHAVYGGIIGSAIAWGVKRGIYSNEAGQGSGAIVSAAAECSHPAKQGLVQAFSVYIDTLIVCTASALIILLTGTFNVTGADGSLLTENAPGILYGIRWAQTALVKAYGTWAGKLLAIVIILFVFTSLMGYYYQAESNVRYIFKDNTIAIWVVRGLFLISSFTGCVLNGEVIWTMGDIGCGSMSWLNIIAILLLSNKGISLLRDYEAQKKEGKNPIFEPDKFDINDETHVWDKYRNN